MLRLPVLVLVWVNLLSAVRADDPRTARPQARRPNILWLIADNIPPRR